MAPKVSHMFVQGSQTCAFAMIYTYIDTFPNVCIGKPYWLKALCREPACIVYCRGASGYASYKLIYSIECFSCLVYRLTCYTLCRKKTKKINNNLMFGALDNPWRYNFCMGMRSSMRLEQWWFRIFDSHLYLKDMPLECLPYFCTGKPYVCNVLCPRAMWKTGNSRHACAHITVMTFTRFAQTSSVGSMLALHGSTMHVAALKPYLRAISI